MREEHQQAIEEKDASVAHRDDQIQALEFTNEEERQAHQQKILRLNEEINDLIANVHVSRRGRFDNVLCFIKKTVEEFTHTTLFDVSKGS